jgi:hypothetical protein
MNAVPKEAATPDPTAAVDDSSPWLGLASFTEETRAYFYGRDEEVAELARRVQRKLLTVLFGQSGLGKTSILRAGLVPRLRGHGYCPIYVRIAYGEDAPEPAEQIKAAIMQNARRSGQWTQVGVAVAGESLWEFLHHRDDVLRDESGATLIPLLIFDQFEEIFTLAQSDEFGRARAARFIAELADLVENRPPKAFEAKLDEDESAAERFDFARSDYRVLIALREDYLAPLEGLKKDIPSLSQNRLRLAPMTGTQALEAVLKPGKRLVSEEVAAAIVRFVAGGAELANAEVEPSLLSLICRELNDARIDQGRSEISLDLLAGSHGTILTNFYERALADQPPEVRRIIEDDLLTDSGFRENVAEERLLSRFAEADAAPGTLALLVNRRLLRIEERLDIRRVELTHDVLCTVVKSSRDKRHEREAREAAEKLLAEQRERELAAHRSMVRARQIAAGCTVLAAVAVVAAVLAYLSGQRAHRAEREAQETRTMADKARGEAERLLGYLSSDFASELESFGRLGVLAEFTGKQIDYYHRLPQVLRGTETTRDAALAMVYHSRALRAMGNLDGAGASADEALQLLEGLRAAGDHSEVTIIGLGLGYAAKARVLESRNDPAQLATSERAAALLRPLAESPKASNAARRAFVDVLVRLGFQQWNAEQQEKAVDTEREAQRIAAEAGGGGEVRDVDMGAYYAEAGGWLMGGLSALGHNDDARRVGADSAAVADRVLERQPGYRLALHAKEIIESNLGDVAANDLDPAAGIPALLRGEETSITLLKLDPTNIVSINNLGSDRASLADALWSAGRLHDALPYRLKAIDNFSNATAGGQNFFINRINASGSAVYVQCQLGDLAGAEATAATDAAYLAKQRRGLPQGGFVLDLVAALSRLSPSLIAFERGDLQAAKSIAAESWSRLQALRTYSGTQTSQKHVALWLTGHFSLTPVLYTLGEFAAVEQTERRALEEHQAFGAKSLNSQREAAQISTWLTMAQARQGHTREAAETIAPVVKFERGLSARNKSDRWVPVELAAALYAQSLADSGKKAALLTEAAALLDGLPPEMRAAHDVVRWRARIRER